MFRRWGGRLLRLIRMILLSLVIRRSVTMIEEIKADKSGGRLSPPLMLI